MEPVLMNATNISGIHAAAGRIPYGAVCQRSANGEVKALVTGTYAGHIGVAIEDNVEHDTPGFFEDGDALSLQSSGTCRLWLLGGQTVNGGNFLKQASTLGAGTEFLGVIQPEGTATTPAATSIARTVGDDVGSADYTQVLSANAASGQKTIELLAANITSLALSVGDYIVIDDDSTAEVNIVAAIGSTSLTLQNNTVNAYTTAATATVYKLTQVECELIL